MRDFTNANKCMEAPPGTLWQDAKGYWLRIAGPDHYEDNVVNIFTGEMIHPSRLTSDLHQIDWNEVMF